MYDKAVIINSDTLGRGDEEVGYTLLGVFLRKIVANNIKPDVIIFYNSGVRLLTHGSYFADILEMIEESGVELIACGTCVYRACGKNSLVAGRISNMDEIADILLNARTVITL